MSFIKKYIKEQCEADSEFRAEYEAEALRLKLVRAREAAGLTQRELAELLGVSQPRIAQVERGSRPMSTMFLLRYAAAVHMKLEVLPRRSAKASTA
ncbi:MAG: helix-turn-helix domain-containing protein [Fimbriimonadaceae bacterium]|nr:helix-turn-helix domain-containing protein [Fimbriimonadaceae bacterium]